MMARNNPGSLLRMAYTIIVFILVALLWQLFIVDSLTEAIQRYVNLFPSERLKWSLAMQFAVSSFAYIILTSNKVFSLVQNISDNRNFVIAEVSMLSVMLIVLILLNCTMSFNFFYFRF